MVALGTFLSSFWILAANSWMHTPSGFEIRDGIFHVTSWIEAIFNPSFPWRLSHMLVASFLIGAFVVAAEIGRASCRERVSVSAVAVTLMRRKVEWAHVGGWR